MALTGGLASTMARLADEVIDTGVPREACPLGVAPTASTTAALAVGDALAVCLIDWKAFALEDFQRFHPGGALGQRLARRAGELMRTAGLPVAPEDASRHLRQSLQTRKTLMSGAKNTKNLRRCTINLHMRNTSRCPRVLRNP